MGHAGVARRQDQGDDLYDRIGAFLAAHRLSPDPAHYTFAYAVLSEPGGELAAEIAMLTDGGYRLTHEQIEQLGGSVVAGGSPPARWAEGDVALDRQAEALVAQTQAQVDVFAAMTKAMHVETRDFGRDLAASAAAIERSPRMQHGDEVTRIATAMIRRIRESEAKLATATEEADTLRAKLKQARDDARRDPLTGLSNRLGFADAFAERVEGSGPHCLALCDIDRFKRVNDEFGHPVGDRVLCAIGEALAAACDGHIVSRHGGEEFAILLAGSDLAGAAALLDEARADVASRRFRDRDTGKPLGIVTISAGVTAIRPGEKADTAFERADRLLYTAKDTGRDKVCAA